MFAIYLSCLVFVSSVLNFIFRRIPLEPTNVRNRLIFGFVVILTTIIGCLDRNKFPGARELLIFLNQYLARYLFFGGCILFALLPSFFMKRANAAKASYVKGNKVCNLLGVACLIVATEVMYHTIQNTVFLEQFYSVEIVQGLIPLCLWIALSYQYQEQRKASELDYSPSLEWTGQVLNVIHLIHTYFWSILSGILLICYTLYCYIHHIPIALNIFHLLAFSMIPLYFYVVALNTHTYLYLLFLAAIPAILVYSIQWQSWSVLGPVMFYVRAVYFLVHYSIYARIVYSKETSKSKFVPVAAGLSAVCVFCCCIRQMPGWLTEKWIIVLSLPLILLELHSIFWKKPLSYQLTLILVPAFLICIVNWTSSFVTTKNMALRQARFVILHFFLYMLTIFCNINPHARKVRLKPLAAFFGNKLPAILAKYIDDPYEAKDEIQEKVAKKLLLGDYFFIVVFAVMILAYPVFSTLPFDLEQEKYSVAVHHINAICDDHQQAEAMLSDIRGSLWYTDDPMLEQKEINRAQYVAFMNSRLHKEMVEKGVISTDDTEATFEQLCTWYSEHIG